jgi:hypothetical protein
MALLLAVVGEAHAAGAPPTTSSLCSAVLTPGGVLRADCTWGGAAAATPAALAITGAPQAPGSSNAPAAGPPAILAPTDGLPAGGTGGGRGAVL